jgi:predicted ArsR family transcriptional regulator
VVSRYGTPVRGPCQGPSAFCDIGKRLAAGADVLNELGGLAEAWEVDDGSVVQAWSCPVAAVVVDHPELCLLVETMLAQIIGLPVQERCDRREPRCFFLVGTSPEDTRRGARRRGGAGPQR